MYRLLICISFIGAISAAPENPEIILEQVRRGVGAEIKKSANYTCVQTIDRTYFENSRELPPGCAYEPQTPIRKEAMHDRLRLDVAVSQGQEIYSWHGENNFSSSTINSVVKNGPISSGGFVGYLENIFFDADIQFTYTGESAGNRGAVYGFKYAVPLAKSRYHVQTDLHAFMVVPFHGSFTVNATNFELASLEVIADGIPANSKICSVDTTVNYQLAPISGRNALIPASVILRIDDSSHVYTVSRGDYSQCREFRGESTLLFDSGADTGQPAENTMVLKGWLPAGMVLHIELGASIDEKTACAGDAIEGVLLDPITLPGTQIAIPKGAILKGIVTQLEQRREPETHYLVKIEFRRLTFGNSAFLLYALHKPTGKEGDKLAFLFGDPLPAAIADRLREGTIIFDSRHLRLNRHFSGEWETFKPVDEKTAALPDPR